MDIENNEVKTAFRIDVVKHQKVPAKIVLYHYIDAVTKRVLKLGNSRLQRKLNRDSTSDLTPLVGPMHEVKAKSIVELEDLITGASNKREKSEVNHAHIENVSETRTNVAATDVQDVATAALPSVAERHETSSTIQPKVSGTLLKFGLEKRTNAGKEFEHFFVDVHDELGATHRRWGVDLERAIAEIGAVRGDQVTVADCGTVSFALPNNDIGYKRLYAMTKPGN